MADVLVYVAVSVGIGLNTVFDESGVELAEYGVTVAALVHHRELPVVAAATA